MSEHNPYNAPQTQKYAGGRSSGTMVPQVRIVAILMMIQGVLEILFGIYFIVMAFVMPEMMANNMANQPNQPSPDQVEMINSVMSITFLAGGGAAGLIGLLRLIAGIMGVQYRGRVLGIFTHFAGFLMLLTCYCFPTALGIGIYGCIVYFNRDVVHAFRLRKEGQSPDQIFAHFGQ